MTNNVSWVAALAPVREKLVALQQEIAAEGGIVMDGRDIGTVVLPHAELKIFWSLLLRSGQNVVIRKMLKKGITADLELLKKEIAERDYKDSHRAVSPLKPAADAIHFDTTGVGIADVVAFIEEKAKKF